MAALSQLPTVSVLLVVSLCCCSGQQTAELTLDSADQQLDALTTRVVDLTNRLEATLKNNVDDQYAVDNLSWKLDKVKGTRGPCQKRFFPCGVGPEGGVQCVRDYLVCDGSADCRSGADEAPAVCDRMPFDKPLTASMMFTRDVCKTDGLGVANLYELGSMVFDRAEIIPWFPSRPKVSYSPIFNLVSLGTPITVVVPFSGVFDYATGDLSVDWNIYHMMAGSLKYQSVSPEESRYWAELDDYDGTILRGERVCMIVNVWWNPRN